MHLPPVGDLLYLPYVHTYSREGRRTTHTHKRSIPDSRSDMQISSNSSSSSARLGLGLATWHVYLVYCMHNTSSLGWVGWVSEPNAGYIHKENQPPMIRRTADTPISGDLTHPDSPPRPRAAHPTQVPDLPEASECRTY